VEKILVSACFLGELVRYDGKANSILNKRLNEFREQKRLVAICPEVSGGLPVPRPPAELINISETNETKVTTINGEDVTQAYIKGANAALVLCLQHNIHYALLKESSPSCGSSTIYDGSFTQCKIAGVGITANLLRQNGIEVFSENTIDALFERMT
jgi:uncharacterized protein YbbK (DUF523 family)